MGLYIVLVDHLQKNKERIPNFKEIGHSPYICQKELDKACFQHGMAFGSLKIELGEQLLIKYCLTKHLILVKTENMMDTKEVLLQWFMIF